MDNAPAPQAPHLEAVCAHLDVILTEGTDRCGPRSSAAWVASLDTTTLSYPVDAPHARVGQRIYRDIDTPFGNTSPACPSAG